MRSATVQSAKIDIIIVNVLRFIDIPFRELSFGVDTGEAHALYATTGLQQFSSLAA